MYMHCQKEGHKITHIWLIPLGIFILFTFTVGLAHATTDNNRDGVIDEDNNRDGVIDDCDPHPLDEYTPVDCFTKSG